MSTSIRSELVNKTIASLIEVLNEKKEIIQRYEDPHSDTNFERKFLLERINRLEKEQETVQLEREKYYRQYSETNSLKKQIEDLEGQSRQQQQQYADLVNECDFAIQNFQQMKYENHELQEKYRLNLDNLRKDYDALSKDHEELTEVCNSFFGDYHSTKKENAKMKKQAEKLLLQIKKKNEKISDLFGKKAKEVKEKKKLKAQVKDLQKMVTSIQTEYNLIKTQQKEQEKKNKGLNDESKNKNSEPENLKATAPASSSPIKSLPVPTIQQKYSKASPVAVPSSPMSKLTVPTTRGKQSKKTKITVDGSRRMTARNTSICFPNSKRISLRIYEKKNLETTLVFSEMPSTSRTQAVCRVTSDQETLLKSTQQCRQTRFRTRACHEEVQNDKDEQDKNLRKRQRKQ